MRRGDHMIILEQQILLERQVWLSTWNSLIATAMILHRRLLSQEVLKNTITLWYYCHCFCSCQWFFYLWVLCPWCIKIPKDKDNSQHTSHRMQRLINQSEQVYFEEKESVLDFLLQGFHYKNKILTILHELQVSAALIQVSAWKKNNHVCFNNYYR